MNITIKEKARAHLFGVCLIDSSFAYRLPASIHLSEYGAFTISMIQQGLGIEAIIKHLEAVGIAEAQDMLLNALKAVPDGMCLYSMFWDAVQVLTASMVRA
ncbi:MAG: hypothetical protein COW19_01950 [Zetaproteobacteria bacterium CG12_big_fil_rev_8_21_14_0_65_55_1124]|nr:MAG: hypothetical protein AUJ58_10080 [Zetaproteobacteria bacterium CG1_02_55_237]PIS19948.1 MAG: hypothetical protein COT53_02860 [Zetaproteobacteria bacterium CG08_land_8_20_14_0_20_55_17]PIW43630.1 MAG: hypothetical protein COW19_01950 [Zetaproteobacteria bacterium CG12_big_fil_rev_8_21_14_0_65_55_1124]PIY52702.1 MAG: hypothetical protein COZ01_06635 [Zetaproteobacteria bacterium CG_4_10_14_0_8_um_filter_55_43]PIZ37886.1 MAG: hypothetical protein COY36_07975 [Zetaproteobacteria bacterium 